jgi:preprotein translocase subunit SecE
MIEPMANPFQFLQEVRQEAAKVTWPNRRETMFTTIAVIVMCIIASLFLFGTDQAIHLLIGFILGLGH